MKIYISGSYAEQKRLRARAAELHALGHQITGTWLNEVQQPSHLTEEEWHRSLGIKDLTEVAAADCIIMDNDGTSTSGGRYVEWGFAIGRFNMLKILVGKSHYGVFTHLADKAFVSWGEAMDYFQKEHDARPS